MAHARAGICCLLSVGFALLCGCGSNPMVGVWNLRIHDDAVAMYGPAVNYFRVTMEFRDDNTYTIKYAKGNEKFEAEGNYQLAGLTLKLTTIKDNGRESRAPTVSVQLSEDRKSFDLPESDGIGRMFKE